MEDKKERLSELMTEGRSKLRKANEYRLIIAFLNRLSSIFLIVSFIFLILYSFNISIDEDPLSGAIVTFIISWASFILRNVFSSSLDKVLYEVDKIINEINRLRYGS